MSDIVEMKTAVIMLKEYNNSFSTGVKYIISIPPQKYRNKRIVDIFKAIDTFILELLYLFIYLCAAKIKNITPVVYAECVLGVGDSGLFSG